jgi:hypothetical protein
MGTKEQVQLVDQLGRDGLPGQVRAPLSCSAWGAALRFGLTATRRCGFALGRHG